MRTSKQCANNSKRSTFILLLTTLLIVSAEYYVLIWPFHRDLIANAPGECYGYTTFYNAGFGSSRWDCLGVRHPDDKVDVRIPPAAPEEETVGNTQRGPR